jgi:drug/metabolite transporter (DMT)-like permease
VYGLLLAALAALLFGASTPASKLLLEGLEPLQLAGLLYLGAALGVAPLVAREGARRGPPLGRADALRLAGAVVLGGVVGPVLLLQAVRLGEAASISLLLHLETAATALFGVLLFREPLGRRGALGVAGVVAAGALLSGLAGRPGLAPAALAAGACAAWGLDNHLTARLSGLSPARSTLAKGALAGAASLALGCTLDPLAATAARIGAALAVGALAYGASIALYIAGAHELGATRAQAVFASAPFLGAALSFAWLGERPGVRHGVAALLLVGSLALLLRSRHAHRHAHGALEHVHSHRHDDGHHAHRHPGLPPATRHTHLHRHEPLVHSHPHWPDLHHRHEHDREGEGG